MAYGADKFLFPIEITSTNNQFRISGSTQTERVITLKTGSFYAHDDDSLTTAMTDSYKGLYSAVKKTLNDDTTFGSASQAASVANWDWSPQTPFSSSNMIKRGLQLEHGGGAFDVTWNHQSMSMDPEWFGFKAETGLTGSATGSGVFFMRSKMMIKGAWMPYTLIDGVAKEKLSTPDRNQKISHERTEDAYQVEWNEDKIRTFIYDYLPAAHVRKGRADTTGHSGVGQVFKGDDHNAFEYLWEKASRLGEIIVVHDYDIAGGDPSYNLRVDSETYEIFRFQDQNERRKLDNCFNRQSIGGEYYEINFEAKITDATKDNYDGSSDVSVS